MSSNYDENIVFEELENLKCLRKDEDTKKKRVIGGRRPMSGVRGIYFQKGFWTVLYAGDNGGQQKIFPYETATEMQNQLKMAKLFLKKVLEKGRQIHESDGEGLTEDEEKVPDLKLSIPFGKRFDKKRDYTESRNEKLKELYDKISQNSKTFSVQKKKKGARKISQVFKNLVKWKQSEQRQETENFDQIKVGSFIEDERIQHEILHEKNNQVIPENTSNLPVPIRANNSNMNGNNFKRYKKEIKTISSKENELNDNLVFKCSSSRGPSERIPDDIQFENNQCYDRTSFFKVFFSDFDDNEQQMLNQRPETCVYGMRHERMSFSPVSYDCNQDYFKNFNSWIFLAKYPLSFLTN